MSSDPLGPPANLTIPLPPGFTPEQWFKLQHDIVSIDVAVSVALALVVWDYFVLLPKEIAFYRSSKIEHWKKPGSLAFVVLRYSGFIACIPSLYFASLQSEHCQVAASLSQTGVVLVTASAGIIFAFRVLSLWRYNKIIYVLVGLPYLVMVGSWLSLASIIRMGQGPSTPYGSNCLPNPVPDWSPLSYASSLAFDSIIFILTLVKLKGHDQSFQRTGGIGARLVKDGTMYFATATAANLLVVIVQALQGTKYVVLQQVILPLPTIINVSMANRVFLNLRLYSERAEPWSSGNSSSSNSFLMHLRLGSRGKERTQTSLPPQSPSYYPSQKGVMVVEDTFTHTDQSQKTTLVA